MAIKSKEELLEQIKSNIADDVSDENISLLEDITDTLNDYETKLSDTTDWEAKYNENDEMWRKKYTERFYSDNDDNNDINNDNNNNENDTKVLTKFEDLFEVKED